MHLFAAQAAIAIQNARLYEEAERRRRAAESLAEVGRLISQSLEFHEVGQRIVDSIRGLLGVHAAILYRLEPESEDLVTVAIAGDVGPAFDTTVVFPRGTAAVGLAVRERQAVSTANFLTDPRITLTPELRARLEQVPYRATLALPLVVKDRVIGALGLGYPAGRLFSQEEARLVEVFANQAAIALENARLFEQVQAEQRLPGASAHASSLEESIGIVSRLLQQVRDLSLDLRPWILDDLGLVAALRWVADRHAQRAGFAAQIVADPLEIRLSPDVAMTCFRVAQEALTNVARHARVQCCWRRTIPSSGLGFGGFWKSLVGCKSSPKRGMAMRRCA